LACLESLERGDYPNAEIIVLDNASKDGSALAIREQFPQVQLIELSENRGYAGNNNVGIVAALDRHADWILVLNEDVILAPDAVSQMVSAAQARPDVGIVGPMVYHYDEPNVIQSAGGILDGLWRSSHAGQNELDQGQYGKPRVVDWISGCSILVRRQVIEQVGSLDERFFYYWEETEWCLRARERGWHVLFVPQARLWHKGVRRDYRPGPNVTYYATRNWLLMLKKHGAPAAAWAFCSWWILKHLVTWTLRPKWRSMREHRDAMWQGVLDFARSRWGGRACL
jgi:GT2 family glycosyltransferase